MLKGALYFSCIALCATLFSAPLLASAISSKPFDRPLAFEPNHGQLAPKVKWATRAPGYRIFIADDSLTFALWESVDQNTTKESKRSPLARGIPEVPLGRVSTLRMTFSGSRPWHATGLDPTGGVSNYLVGNDSKKWRTGIPQYGRLKLSEVYPGIDLMFYGSSRNLEYDFLLA